MTQTTETHIWTAGFQFGSEQSFSSNLTPQKVSQFIRTKNINTNYAANSMKLSFLLTNAWCQDLLISPKEGLRANGWRPGQEPEFSFVELILITTCMKIQNCKERAALCKERMKASKLTPPIATLTCGGFTAARDLLGTITGGWELWWQIPHIRPRTCVSPTAWLFPL